MIESVLNKFKDSVKRGTGEAFLILHQNPELDCSDILLHASINTLAYDPQVEGSREVYMLELIGLSVEKKAIEQALIQHLLFSKDDDWGIFQVFSMAGLMARQGNTEAKEVIYQRYAQNLNPDFPFVDTRTPIDLDGYEGLKFIAEVKGKMLLNNPDEW